MWSVRPNLKAILDIGRKDQPKVFLSQTQKLEFWYKIIVTNRWDACYHSLMAYAREKDGLCIIFKISSYLWNNLINFYFKKSLWRIRVNVLLTVNIDARVVCV